MKISGGDTEKKKKKKKNGGVSFCVSLHLTQHTTKPMK